MNTPYPLLPTNWSQTASVSLFQFSLIKLGPPSHENLANTHRFQIFHTLSNSGELCILLLWTCLLLLPLCLKQEIKWKSGALFIFQPFSSQHFGCLSSTARKSGFVGTSLSLWLVPWYRLNPDCLSILSKSLLNCTIYVNESYTHFDVGNPPHMWYCFPPEDSVSHLTFSKEFLDFFLFGKASVLFWRIMPYWLGSMFI